MKVIDKFLKWLGTDRNTFATYILTLITAYILVDRVVEMLLMLFTGVSYSYWGPIQYTLALACPAFAYAFSVPSKFSPTKKRKVELFNVYIIALTVIAVSMFTQWLNGATWLLLVFNPGYVDLVTNFSDLVRPALTSLTFIFPIIIIPKIFNFLYFGVNDSKDMTQSIWDYGGVDLSDKSIGHGPYTCDIYICQNSETAAQITMPESSRYQSLFVCGASGSGKTSLIFEPLIARDLDKKFFYREVAKEMGFTALKTGIATLTKPYDNDYLNSNFNLNMLTPTSGNEDVYKGYMKKMILGTSPEITYRDCGITVMSPDKEISTDMIDVCKNLRLPYNVIDPLDKDSMGLNPFIYDDPNKIAITISSVIKSVLNVSQFEQFKELQVIQAVENTSILLKEMYPRINEGMLPNLKDMLEMFTNFELIEKMCKILEQNDELKEKYKTQLVYFKNNFYTNSPNKEKTQSFISIVADTLDRLLRVPGIRNILCNRSNNVDFDKSLANGNILFVCTRRGDLGEANHKAFGLFFLMSMQNAVLRRPGTEKTRVPNFLYIDEFPDFINKSTEPIFTMYRKYKVGTVISAQNLKQLEVNNERQTILANCASKIFTGGGNIEDLNWWSDEFGQKREWNMSNTIDFSKGEYDSKHGGVEWKFVPYFKPGKLQSLGQTDCAYKIRSDGGKILAGQGKLHYLESKYKEPKKTKEYDFGKFTDKVTTAAEDTENGKYRKKFNPSKLDFKDDRDEIDPIQTDTTDSSYLFDNEDAIVVNFKNKKKKK